MILSEALRTQKKMDPFITIFWVPLVTLQIISRLLLHIFMAQGCYVLSQTGKKTLTVRGCSAQKMEQFHQLFQL